MSSVCICLVLLLIKGLGDKTHSVSVGGVFPITKRSINLGKLSTDRSLIKHLLTIWLHIPENLTACRQEEPILFCPCKAYKWKQTVLKFTHHKSKRTVAYKPCTQLVSPWLSCSESITGDPHRPNLCLWVMGIMLLYYWLKLQCPYLFFSCSITDSSRLKQ